MAVTYKADGAVEGLVAQGIVDIITYDFATKDIFREAGLSTVNVRRAGLVGSGNERKMPGIAVDALPESTLAPGMQHYHVRCLLTFESDGYDDASVEQMDNMLGAWRDIINQDANTGSSNANQPYGGFIDRFNDQVRGFVILPDGFREVDSNDNDGDHTRRRIVNVDIWGYVGYASA